jgi:hypothetical protein
MTTRRTAYLTRSVGTSDACGQVTIDLYVLWPKGSEHSAESLLDAALLDLRALILRDGT